ncbi:MAG: HlyU family transcriptional regulator [Halopseudomonas sp.]
MSLLSMLKMLLTAPAAEQPATAITEEYKGFTITPAPIKQAALYRVAATISKGDQSHQLIRADEMSDHQECVECSLRKARLMIDQQGDSLF